MSKKTKTQTQATLENIGLSPEEAEVYLCLLEHGTESATDIARRTSVKRTYVYKVADDLAKKGMLVHKKAGRTTMFEPTSPDHLLSLAEAKKAEVNQAERQLESVLGTLKDKYTSVDSKPIIQIFEGVEGIKKMYMDTIKEGKDILALLEPSPESPIKAWIKETYVPQRVEANIHAKVIMATNKHSDDYKKRSSSSHRQVKEVDSAKYKIKNEVNIYGDKISFLKAQKDGVPVGFIIEHPEIAQTMKAWFELAWKKTNGSPSKQTE